MTHNPNRFSACGSFKPTAIDASIVRGVRGRCGPDRGHRRPAIERALRRPSLKRTEATAQCLRRASAYSVAATSLNAGGRHHRSITGTGAADCTPMQIGSIAALLHGRADSREDRRPSHALPATWRGSQRNSLASFSAVLLTSAGGPPNSQGGRGAEAAILDRD